jgi:pyridoxine 4-dehydrogenase
MELFPGSLSTPILPSCCGLSNITPNRLAEAQRITEIVCVQNFHNLTRRGDDAFIDALAKQGVAYVPFFPLGGFTQVQSSGLDRMAASLQATPVQVALAWLLQRSPNILLIPGTSSTSHPREGVTRNFWKDESHPSLSILGNLPRTRSRGP